MQRCRSGGTVVNSVTSEIVGEPSATNDYSCALTSSSNGSNSAGHRRLVAAIFRPSLLPRIWYCSDNFSMAAFCDSGPCSTAFFSRFFRSC